jgi:hypothetical protein
MIKILNNNEFKSCPSCNESWKSREDFLADSKLELVGYQVHFKTLEQGLFLFNHIACKSTISIQSGRFANLYNGPIYSKNMLGTDSCPEHCLFKSNLDACPAQCECTYVRDIMQVIKTWNKSGNKGNTDGLD